MKKTIIIILLLCSKYSIGQQVPSEVQIRYALQEFGRNLKSHNVKNIMDMSSPALCIAEYRDRALTDVMPQLVNPVELDTVYFESILKKHNKIYAKQIAVPKKGPKMSSWLRMNNFLALERVGHFEQLMGLPDPVSQELMPARLLGKAALTRSSSLMFVSVSVQGSTKNYNFLFDSGAGATTLSEGMAAELKLKVNDKTVAIKTAGNSGQFKTVDTMTLKIAGLDVHAKQAVVADLNNLEKIVGQNLDGIIGFDFLKEYQVAVDLDKAEISVYNFGFFEGQENAHILPIKLTNNIPLIEANLNIDGNNYPSILLFDTGAGGSIYGNHFLNAYTKGLSDRLKNKRTSSSMDLSGHITKSETGGIDGITVAGLTLKNPVLALDLPEVPSTNGFNRHGLLGMTLIGKFNMIFNYNRNYIQLSPNQAFSVPMVPLYALGIGFSRDGAQFLVNNPAEDGLAYKAGLRDGDQLLKINQQVPVSVDHITRQLRVLGAQAIVLEVKRGQQKLKIKLEKLKV